jgi:hypothetical protein
MIIELEGAGIFRLMTRSTVERDIVLSNMLRSSGAEQAMRDAIIGERNPDGEIFQAVASSGKLFDILGASLAPDGMEDLEWTPACGLETSSRLKAISAAQAKILLLSCVVELIKAFFLAGLLSTATSRRSSPAQDIHPPPNGASAEITTSAIGV